MIICNKIVIINIGGLLKCFLNYFHVCDVINVHEKDLGFMNLDMGISIPYLDGYHKDNNDNEF